MTPPQSQDTGGGARALRPSLSLLAPLLASAISGLPQCVAVIDPDRHTLRPLDVLREIQNSHESSSESIDRRLLEAELRELHRQRLDYLALHGNAAPPSGLDEQINRLSRALRPLLIEFNPTAHQINLALPLSPGNSIVVAFDDDACQKFLLPSPGDSVRHLATTLARGFRGEALYPQWRCHASTAITTHPRLSVVFMAKRPTIAALISTPLLLEVGLAQEIIPIERTECAEPDLDALIRLMPNLIDERYSHSGPLNVPKDIQHLTAPERMQKRVRDAILRWNGHLGARGAREDRAAAWSQVRSLRENLLSARDADRLNEEERVMLEKLRMKGTWSLREIARKYPTSKQPKTYLEPILTRLIAKGAVRIARGDRYYALPEEGDEASPLTLLTC